MKPFRFYWVFIALGLSLPAMQKALVSWIEDTHRLMSAERLDCAATNEQACETMAALAETGLRLINLWHFLTGLLYVTLAVLIYKLGEEGFYGWRKNWLR